MIQSLIDRLSAFINYSGQVVNEGTGLPSDPQEETSEHDKFHISSDELKIVGVALNHYKNLLQQKKSFEKLEKVADLDNRIFHFIASLEEHNQNQGARMS